MKQATTSCYDEQVLAAIWDIQQAKCAARRHPQHALLVQDGLRDRFHAILTNEGMTRVLTRLEAAGKIRQCRTINDTALFALQATTE